MKRKSLDEMMAGMGFATSDIGPNVTELRVIVGHQIDNGLINRSAGTWAPEHGPAGMKLSAEERAAAFLEVESAIEKRMYRQLDFRDETTREARNKAENDVVQYLRETAGKLINGDIEDGAIEAAMLVDASDEIERLRSIVRVNGLRWGHSHADVDAILKDSNVFIRRSQ